MRYFTGKPCRHGHVAERKVANGICVECHAIIAKKSRERRRPEIAAREREYWSTRVEQRRAKNRKHAARMTDEQRQQAAKTKREYYDRNKILCVERAAEWRRLHPEKDREHRRKYAERHPELIVAKDRRRRSRVVAATAGDRRALAAELRRLKKTPDLPCHWCHKPTTPARRHIDHIVPLRRGGAHAIANLCVACPPCNQQKADKLPEEFLAKRGTA